MTTHLTRRTVFISGACLPAVIVRPSLASGQGKKQESVRVLTAHPVTFALASALSKGSRIAVEAVQPARLPATRLTSYLAGRGKAALAEAARRADAVITFRSFWPDDPFYPHARRSNIRIVEIDAGQPLDGALPGIAVAESRDDGALYKALGLQPMPATGEGSAPWLAPTNMGRMAGILAGDLTRLDPSSLDAIAANLGALKQRLLALKTEADVALAGPENLSAIALSPRFSYLAADLGIDLRASITAAPAEWTPERAAKLTAWLKDDAVTAVLLDAAPSDNLADAIKAASARFAVLASIEGESDDPASVIQANIRALADLFGRRDR